jgi:hypothetical protein
MSPSDPDYGIETVNGMAWLARAVEADETIKRRMGEEVIVYIQRLMPVDALRIRGRHNATNAPWRPWAWRWRPDAAWAPCSTACGTTAASRTGWSPVAVIQDGVFRRQQGH